MSLVAALSAATLLALAASAAGDDVWIEPAGSASMVSQGTITFGSSPTIACNLTLAATLVEDEIDIRTTSHIGEFTEVRIANCSGGSVSAVLSLPWEITLDSVEGEYPNELAGLLVDIADVGFDLSVFGGFVNCLYGGTAGAALVLTETGDAGLYDLETVASLEEVLLPRLGGSGLCPDEGGLAGEFAFTPEQLVVTQPLGEIEVSPMSVTIPADTTDGQWIVVRNRGIAGSTDIDITQGSLDITADDDGIVIAPGETCEGNSLVGFHQNECRIGIVLDETREGARPHRGTLDFEYSTGPVTGVDVEIPLLAE